MQVEKEKKKKKKKDTCFVGFNDNVLLRAPLLRITLMQLTRMLNVFFLYYSFAVNYSDYLCTRLINRETGRRSDKVGKEKSLLYISKGGIIYALWKRRIDSLELILNLENKIKSGGVAR